MVHATQKQRQRKKPRRMSVGRRRSFFEKPDDLDEDERSLFVTQICERANNSYAAGAENAVRSLSLRRYPTLGGPGSLLQCVSWGCILT